MGLFDFFRKQKEIDLFAGATRDMAKGLMHAQLEAIKQSKKTERLTMERGPADEKGGINIEVNYQGSDITAPYYAYYIVKSLAKVIDISFEDMISHMKVYEELMPEIAEEESELTKEEDKD